MSTDTFPPSEIVDVFFVGVGKCGTSWIYRFFQETGVISVPSVKEPYLLDMAPKERQSAMKRLYAAPDGRPRAEFSNLYYWDVDNPKRIHDYNPSARIVLTVRKPSERAISHFRFLARNGLVDENGFRDYIGSDDHELVARSDYQPMVDRYIEQFGANAVCVLPLELLQSDPAAYVARLAEHLDITIPAPTSEQAQPTLAAQGARFPFINRRVHMLGSLVRKAGLLRAHAAIKESALVRRVLFTEASQADDLRVIAGSVPRIAELDRNYEPLLAHHGIRLDTANAP